MNLFQSAFAQYHAIESSIMANNRLFAARAADVKLKTVRAMVEREIESRDGVFWRVNPRPAMAEQ
jgi:hypothetical protein